MQLILKIISHKPGHSIVLKYINRWNIDTIFPYKITLMENVSISPSGPATTIHNSSQYLDLARRALVTTLSLHLSTGYFSDSFPIHSYTTSSTATSSKSLSRSTGYSAAPIPGYGFLGRKNGIRTRHRLPAEEVGRGYDDIQMSHDKYRLHDNIIAYFTFRA